MSVDLRIKIGKVEFKNPVWTASGTFGYGDEFHQIFDINQLGAFVTKSITLLPRKGTIPPRIVETPSGMLNAIGLANIGLEKFIEQKIPFYRTLQTKVIVNVAGSTDEEYCQIVERLDSFSEITGFELNFSCPNVKEGGICFGVSPVLIRNLTQKIRRLTDKLIIVKLTPNVTDIASTAIAAEEGGADAVSLINTLVGLSVDIETMKPRLGNITGGLSGPAIKPIALAKVMEVYRAVHIPIIGMGGITNADDAIEFFLTGSTAIQIGTANFINPTISVKIIEGIKSYCNRKKLSSIYHIIGKLKVS